MEVLHVVLLVLVIDVVSGLEASNGYSEDFTKNGSQCSKPVTSTLDELRRRALQLITCSDQLDSCCELRAFNRLSGIYSVQGHEAVCDMISSGGGWMVIQRRGLASGEKADSFVKNYTMYEYGFGNANGDFWLGLEALHMFTSSGSTELLIDLVVNESRSFAHYDHFSVAGSNKNYTLNVSGYDGSMPDYLSLHVGSPFSAIDRDHDNSMWLNCAAVLQSGWWFTPQCGPVIPHVKSDHVSISWGNLTFTGMEMKIRPYHYLCGNV